MRPFLVYLLRCSDGTYYCGHTDDIENRMQQHHLADSGYTSTRKPVQLAWQGEFETREAAIKFERQVKGWSRAKKDALVIGDWSRIQGLARARTGPKAVRTGKFFVHEEDFSSRPEQLAVHPAPAVVPRGSIPGQPRPSLDPGLEVGSDFQKNVAVAAGLRQAQPERNDALGKQLEAQPEHERHQVETHLAQSERRLVWSGKGLADAVVTASGSAQRRAMAKAITLLESTRADHRLLADALLNDLLPHTGRAFRLGLSGVPGVGKSTFIEVLGLHLIGLGRRVAVLTIDPSSSVSGGSILGDKTRMEQLSMHPQAFIRPSPSGGTLGGVAAKTREAMLVCEAAGYDVVIVETVGVGQSEIAVAGMTDMFVLMQLPNAGDELQAIKKGVMEIADLVVINKADIDAAAATRALAQIASSLRLLGQHGNPAHALHDGSVWHPQVMALSALHRQGVDVFWAMVERFRALQEGSGALRARRRGQSLSWMWERIESGLRQAFRDDPLVGAQLGTVSEQVAHGTLVASVAARDLLALFGRMGGRA